MSDQGRNADILQSIVDDVPYTDPPQSRIEDLLLQVKEVIEEGGGTKIRLADVSGAAVATSFNTATLTWSDPEDIVVSGAILAKWDGTKVLRKAGSAPESITDGVVVVDNKTKNQYSSNGYEDTGLEYGVMYYYRWFPYTDQNIITDGSAVSVTPVRTKITTVPTQDGTLTYDGTVQTASWNDYDSSKMTVTGDTGTNAGTYTAQFTPKDGYCWDDDTTTAKAVQWVIDKAAGVVTLSESTISLNADTTYADIVITATGGGALSVESSDTTVATVGTIENNVFRVTADEAGTATITVSMAASDNYTSATATAAVTVKYLEIVTWSDGTPEQITAMIEAADRGDINLSDYWTVGDTRSVDISSFNGNSTATHVAQTVEMVLVQEGLYKDTDDKTVHFVVGFKNCLANGTTLERERIDNSSSGVFWSGSEIRTLCNGNLYNAFPQWLKNLVRTVKVTTGTSNTENETTEDKVFLAAEKELGYAAASGTAERNALTTFTYYSTVANKIKHAGRNGSAVAWWLRSHYYANKRYYCRISNTGDNANTGYIADDGLGVAAHFCI